MDRVVVFVCEPVPAGAESRPLGRLACGVWRSLKRLGVAQLGHTLRGH